MRRRNKCPVAGNFSLEQSSVLSHLVWNSRKEIRSDICFAGKFAYIHEDYPWQGKILVHLPKMKVMGYTESGRLVVEAILMRMGSESV